MTAAVLFPGQGAQALGMGLDLAAAEPAAAAVYERAAEVLGRDLREVIGGEDRDALDRTDACQPAILITSLACMEALDARGTIDRARVGHTAGLSLGEYSALTWAGALDLDDALRVVQERGRAMQAASDERPSGMLSLVGATAEAAGRLCDAARGDGVLVVANLLAPGQVAIAGTDDALARAEASARGHGVRRVVRLSVAGAFHSPCMASASAALRSALDSIEIRPPAVDVVMNVSGEPTRDPDAIRALLAAQVTSPVLWEASMRSMLAAGCRAFLEPGPGRQLTNMLKRYEEETAASTCGDPVELAALRTWPEAAA